MQLCSNCECSRSEYSCLDCPVLERNFCISCCDLHTKVKSTKDHRLILSGPKLQIASETKDMAISQAHTEDILDVKLCSFDSCSSKSVCPCKNFSSADVISKIGLIIDKVYDICTALVDTTDFFALLAFFEIDTVLDKFPLTYALIPIICLLALAMMVSSEVITNNGSSIAMIIGAIAFLQRSRWRNGSMQFGNEKIYNSGPIHPNRRKNSLCVTSARPFDGIQNSNLPTHRNLHAHNYRKKNDEVTEDVEGNETEDSYTEGSEVGTENDEEDFKDEFYYRRHHKMTHLPEKKRISHYRKKSVDLKR